MRMLLENAACCLLQHSTLPLRQEKYRLHASCIGLTCNFDAGGSIDSDGTIVGNAPLAGESV